MLANGIKLSISDQKSTGYTEYKTVKEVPDLGSDPELVENTVLGAKNKQYENGVGDLGDMEYKFKGEDNKEDSETRKLLKMSDAGEKKWFKETYPDGTEYVFEGTPSVKITGGGLNDPIELIMKVAVSSDIERKDPEE